MRHGEAAQAGDAGGDGDGEIEGEEGLAALGLAADDADGLLRTTARSTSQRCSSGRSARRQAGSTGSRLIAAAGSPPWSRSPAGTAQVSKNSFSSIWRASRWAATASSSPAMFIRARGLPWA